MANLVNLVGYHLTFDAEMTTAADMSKFGNAFYNGDTTLWTNHEAENYRPYDPKDLNSPYSFAKGALTITASPTTVGSLPYASGLLQTAETFQQNQGYFEIRAQATGTQGFWPAFWLLPTSYYPELDILEQPNTSGSNSSYWTHISTPTDNSGGFSNVGVDLSAGYHSYGLMWTATSLQFSFDGRYIGSAHATPAALAGLKMYLIANLAVGGPGSWPGQPVAGTSATFAIDYIRAYSNDPTAPAVVPGVISSPDGADTAPVLSIAAVTVGSGPDALALQVSEDALKGNAKFTISIDGVQQGGVQTALALQGAGQTQSFKVLGTFGTSVHNVSIDFLNDLTDADGDRNLFVTGAAINGVAVPGAVVNGYSGGAQGFSFTGNKLQPTLARTVIGTGTDIVLFGLSEDAYAGDAQFTVSIDGVQQGGIQTVAASHAAGQSQAFAVQGSFGPGIHTAIVNFLNDAWGGSAATDRNLYVDSISYDGVALPKGTAALLTPGPVSFLTPVQRSGNAVPLSQVTIGTGADTFLFGISEDAYQGDALFTISIDGVQQGGIQSAAALHSAGESQVFAVLGVFGPGIHAATVSFLNDAYGGSAAADRNLYVDKVSYDGVALPNGTAALLNQGAVDFIAPAKPGAVVPPLAQVTIGTGADVFLFGINEDAYQGDALFTIGIDGVQQGGIQSTTASRLAGQSQTFAVQGSFGPGIHIATVNFLNDAWGGSAATDRNLYVGSVSYDGVALQNGTAALLTPGPVSFITPAQPGTVVSPLSQVTIGTGADTFLFGLSEDAYQGDALFTISIDGVQQGGIQSTAASHVAGQSKAFAVQGSFGTAAHTATINFLNDAHGDSAAADRNLYVDSVRYDGVLLPNGTAPLLTQGPLGFTFPGTGANASAKLDSLSVSLTEDAFQGDAAAQITIDGKVLGNVMITFLNSAATPEVFTYTGDFGSGAHKVGVSFLNDAYGGSADADRNLYVKGITFNAIPVASATAALLSPGTAEFTVPAAPTLIVPSHG